MKKQSYFMMLLLAICSLYVQAQTTDGVLKGLIADSTSKKPIEMATVLVLSQGVEVANTFTLDDGQYSISALKPGKYTVKVFKGGYGTKVMEQVMVSTSRITFQDFYLPQGIDLPTISVTYLPPVIEKDDIMTARRIDATEIRKSVLRDVKDFARLSTGAVQKREGGEINFRGSRGNGTHYIVDGIRMDEGFSMPRSAIAELVVITGGVPAMYGDATGGIIVITTKGFFGSGAQ
ncbi:MAG: carboxypeptidase regulatory-like domain-containing protein [Bacteroidetes bacterium]|nr:carboxypeptidase regulatory-like domain-containing protein [Bacteroidota bacterium]